MKKTRRLFSITYKPITRMFGDQALLGDVELGVAKPTVSNMNEKNVLQSLFQCLLLFRFDKTRSNNMSKHQGVTVSSHQTCPASVLWRIKVSN